MYEITEGIEIDFVNTKKYPGQLYVSGGKVSGVGFVGSIQPTVINYSCGETNTINFFINPHSFKIEAEYSTVEDSCNNGIHIGGVITTCTDCKNVNSVIVLMSQNDCTKYKRAFTDDFDAAFNKISVAIDTCVDGNGFGDDVNCDFDIDGNVVCVPITTYDGNLFIVDGNEIFADGNLK